MFTGIKGIVHNISSQRNGLLKGERERACNHINFVALSNNQVVGNGQMCLCGRGQFIVSEIEDMLSGLEIHKVRSHNIWLRKGILMSPFF